MKKPINIAIVLLSLILNFENLSIATEPADQDFDLLSLTGQSVQFSNLLGKKNIVINFWASWCDSCEEEIPQLLQLKEQAKPSDDVVFLGINAGDSQKSAQRFVDKTHYNYTILLDLDKVVAKHFKITGVPQTLIISKEGKMVYRGSRPPKSLAQALNTSTASQ